MLPRDYLWCALQLLLDEEERTAALCPSCRAQAEQGACPVCGCAAELWQEAQNESFDEARFSRLKEGDFSSLQEEGCSPLQEEGCSPLQEGDLA